MGVERYKVMQYDINLRPYAGVIGRSWEKPRLRLRACLGFFVAGVVVVVRRNRGCGRARSYVV